MSKPDCGKARPHERTHNKALTVNLRWYRRRYSNETPWGHRAFGRSYGTTALMVVSALFRTKRGKSGMRDLKGTLVLSAIVDIVQAPRRLICQPRQVKGTRVLSPGSLDAHRQAGKPVFRLGLLHYGVQLRHHLVHRHGVHLPAAVVSLLNQLLEIAAGHLGREPIRDHQAGPLFLLHPRRAGKGNPHRPAVDVETYVP